MKEDILEQLVDGYFLRQPATFTKHNVKFKPKKEDIALLDNLTRGKFSVHSDIDVLAIHLNEENEKKVSVVSCKSWQDGFDIDLYYNHLIDEEKRNVKKGTGPIWKRFRELVEPNWAKAFREKIYEETNSYDFTYYIAVTKITKKSKIEDFENCDTFLNLLSDNGKNKVKIKFLTLGDIVSEIMNENSNTTVESTEIGRFLQLIKAAGLKFQPTTTQIVVP